MCGIFGVWNKSEITGRHLLEASALLRHRGPDDEGFTIFNADGARHFSGTDSVVGLPLLQSTTSCANALLHRRLSILDLSEKGHQPMHLENRYYLVFNGEIYNFRTLIESYDLNVTTGTDTEVILLLYAQLGMDCFQHFRGMWALAIVDLERNELILSRDRFGIKPLYFHEVGKELVFASELKPLLALPDIQAQWKEERLLEFLLFGAASDPYETFFEGISAVKPGHSIVFDLDSGAKAALPYYEIGTVIPEMRSADFTTHFENSIDEHLIADVAVGSCLSGGLDSSLIVANAAQKINYPFHTFTASFPGEPIDEAVYARKLERASERIVQHFTTPSAAEFGAAIDDLIWSIERPFGSASVFAQRAVMATANTAGTKVLLDGQGADEVFGGYYPFAGAFLIDHLRGGRIRLFFKDYKALKANFNPKMRKAMMRAAYYHLPAWVQRIGRKKMRKGAAIIAPAFRKKLKKLRSPARAARGFHNMARASVAFGLYELLHYEDRNSMRFSIETRVPFLDHRLVEWGLAQNPGDLLREGWTKYPLRKSLDSLGFNELAWRKDKIGFAAPQLSWMKALRPQLEELLQKSRWPEQIDKAAFYTMWNGEMQSAEDQTAFWRIFSLLRWYNLFEVEIV